MSFAVSVTPDTAFDIPTILSSAIAVDDVVTVTPDKEFKLLVYNESEESLEAVKVPPLIVLLVP